MISRVFPICSDKYLQRLRGKLQKVQVFWRYGKMYFIDPKEKFICMHQQRQKVHMYDHIVQELDCTNTMCKYGNTMCKQYCTWLINKWRHVMYYIQWPPVISQFSHRFPAILQIFSLTHHGSLHIVYHACCPIVVSRLFVNPYWA